MTLWLGHSRNGRSVLPLTDLSTHVFICGATGSGKTVLGKLILQEAAMAGVPALAVDLKGDLSSMAVPLQRLDPTVIEPFMEERADMPRSVQAAGVTEDLGRRLAVDGLHEQALEEFRTRCSPVVFTPRSRNGVPVGCAPVTSAPVELAQLSREEPEVVAVLAASQAGALLQRAYPGGRLERMQSVLPVSVLGSAWPPLVR